MNEPSGRRATGQTFKAGEVPQEALPKPIVKEPEIHVPKRSAKRTAEAISGKPCRCKERGGYCIILVEQDVKSDLAFTGRTWWLALRQLHAHFSKHA